MVRQLVAQQQMAAATAKAPQQAVPVGAGAEVPEGAAEGFVESDPTTWGNPGRNDPCPCGSGKKFKHCHGRLV